MNIKVRLFATLREGRGKELALEVKEGSTPAQVLAGLNITAEEVAILLINGRDGLLETQLADGDTISVFPPVGGG